MTDEQPTKPNDPYDTINALPPVEVGGKTTKKKPRLMPQKVTMSLDVPTDISYAQQVMLANQIKQRLKSQAKNLGLLSPVGKTFGEPSMSGLVSRLGTAGQTIDWVALQRAVVLRLHDQTDQINPALLEFMAKLDVAGQIAVIPGLTVAEQKQRMIVTRKPVKAKRRKAKRRK